MSFLDKMRGNVKETLIVAQEGVDELQARHDLTRAYRDLGRRTVELIDRGSLEAPALELEVAEIRRLKEQIGDGSELPEATAAATL